MTLAAKTFTPIKYTLAVANSSILLHAEVCEQTADGGQRAAAKSGVAATPLKLVHPAGYHPLNVTLPHLTSTSAGQPDEASETTQATGNTALRERGPYLFTAANQEGPGWREYGQW